MKKTALVAGATGLIGKELVYYLLSDPAYDKVKVVTRKSTKIADNKLEKILVDFKSLKDHADKLTANHYFILLGTTMRKAKSKEKFYEVDFTYSYQLAEIAKNDPGFEKFLIATTYKASPHSMIFYNRVKGQLEEALKAINLKSLHIFQPSLLLGFRNEFRLFEEASKIILPILEMITFGQIKFKAIEATTVAKAMLKVGKEGITGLHVYPSHIIEELSISSLLPEDINA